VYLRAVESCKSWASAGGMLRAASSLQRTLRNPLKLYGTKCAGFVGQSRCTQGTPDSKRYRGHIMTDMSRRRFIETAGLAAVTPALMKDGEAAAQGQNRGAAPRKTSRARDLTDQELEA